MYRSGVRRAMRFAELRLLLSTFMILGPIAAAKCPTGTVTVQGEIADLPTGSAPAGLAVTLETPKGNFSKTAPISTGEFDVEVLFPTRSSSFLGGDRCNNLPTIVDVRITAAEKVHVQRRIDFKDNFEMYDLRQYRLRHRLSIDALKERGAGGPAFPIDSCKVAPPLSRSWRQGGDFDSQRKGGRGNCLSPTRAATSLPFFSCPPPSLSAGSG
jgi:hypothetical protein